MYSNIVRTDEYKRRLGEFVNHEYGLHALAINPAKRGYYGETWRFITSDTSYFIKLVYPVTHTSVH